MSSSAKAVESGVAPTGALRAESRDHPAPPAAAAEGDADDHRLLAVVDAWHELPAPLYAAMLAIWHAVPSLQRRFPLHTGRLQAALAFSSWCVAEGRRRYAILREIPTWDAALSAPFDLPPMDGDGWADTWSLAQFLYGYSRHHCSTGAMVGRAAARNQVAVRWWRGDRHQRCAPAPADWQYDALRARFETISALLAALREPGDNGKSDKQLIVEFGLGDVQSRFERGAAQARETPKPVRLDASLLRTSGSHVPLRWLKFVHRARTRLRRRPSEAELSTVMQLVKVGSPPVVRSEFPFGVNLYGYAYGEIGIGEDVRFAALALQAHGIPCCIVNVRPGDNVSQLDRSLHDAVVDAPRYAINLFCITGKEHVRFVCEQGLAMFRGRYTIGMWPWELPRWPTSLHHAYAVVDEIWGISRYTAQAYADAPCRVTPMTLAVAVDGAGPETRADFGLPTDSYLFAFSFDFNSTATRKNPEAVIEAFQRAFPKETSAKVGLVVKASHGGDRHKAWRRLRQLAAADPRVHLVDRTLRRAAVLALYRCCDCYVSLHRAEGFGRGIAEALLLGKQVVTTGFSGNLDFCEEPHVGLVDHRLVALRADEYFHGDGQCWAEPDLVHASRLLRDVYETPRPAIPARRFDPQHVGAVYGSRLREIASLLGTAPSAPAVTDPAPRTIARMTSSTE
jgi:hypothetical protein